MNIVTVSVVIVVLLFVLAYFTRRRFGVLGLALCAGGLLSTIWTADATSFVAGAGFETLSPPLSTVVAAALVLLPAIILLFSGPTYTQLWKRVVGAAAFALLATAFLLPSLADAMVLDATGRTIYRLLIDNRNLIITATIAYALFDLLTLKTPKHKEK
ncbi:MAG: conserved rane protein of unknown function [Candidatus Saccharibacteria bacterium]|nr:conserved rane protein of unknown function [Candidatus Saccharibacteria bacterium]